MRIPRLGLLTGNVEYRLLEGMKKPVSYKNNNIDKCARSDKPTVIPSWYTAKFAFNAEILSYGNGVPKVQK